MIDTLEGRASTEKDFDKLEKQTDRNLLKFRKAKYRVLYLE